MFLLYPMAVLGCVKWSPHFHKQSGLTGERDALALFRHRTDVRAARAARGSGCCTAAAQPRPQGCGRLGPSRADRQVDSVGPDRRQERDFRIQGRQRPRPGDQGHQFLRPALRIRMPAGAQRLRQDHNPQHSGRPVAANSRRHPHWRRATRQQQTEPRRRVPGFRATVPLAHGAAQRRVWPGNAQGRQGRARANCNGIPTACGPGKIRRRLSPSTLRRHAATRRDRALARL